MNESTWNTYKNMAYCLMGEAQTPESKKFGKYAAKHKAIEREEKKKSSKLRSQAWGSGEGTRAQAGQMGTDYGHRAAASKERAEVAAARAKQGIETGKRAARSSK